MADPVRLQRYLAAAGVAARRKAELLITAGRVKVNGEIVRVLGTKVDPDSDEVEVDGEAVVAQDKFYVLLNKPKACITAVTDDRGRPTVMDYLPNLPVKVKPVGRLDFYTEGVLLLTNDGELAARLLAPGNHVPKTYHVKVHGQLTGDDVKLLRQGVQLDDGAVTMPADVEILPGESKYTWLAITIHEGKHRQIHRMLEALGYAVDKLQRVAFANLSFHDLRIGDARELSQYELNALRDTVGLDHSSVARGSWSASREDTDIPRRARAKARAEAEAEADAAAAAAAARADAPDESAGPDDLDDWTDPGARDDDSDVDDRDDTGGATAGPRESRGVSSRSKDAGASRDAGGPRGSRSGGGGRSARSDAGERSTNARGPRSDDRGAGGRGPRSDDRGGVRSEGARNYGTGGARGDGGAGGARGPRSYERGAGARSEGGPRGAGARSEGGPRSYERGAGARSDGGARGTRSYEGAGGSR
ncbi:MAG: pseudouridine synthase, partial [Kofleriaceae bacterium]